MYIFYTSLELTWLDEAGGGNVSGTFAFQINNMFPREKKEWNKKKEMQQVSLPLWRGRQKSREWVK